MIISDTDFWIIVAGLAAGTFAVRYLIIGLSHKFVITDRVKQLFTYIPAAILPAFIVPSTYFHKGQVDWLFNHERFIIAVAACVLSYFVRGTLAVIAFGLGALYLVTHAL